MILVDLIYFAESSVESAESIAESSVESSAMSAESRGKNGI